ncbi:MAG: hypothetical protein ACRCXT_05600 [Paraclostridium sp.]
MYTYFTGYEGISKATLNGNSLEQIEVLVNDTKCNHIGGYKALDGTVILEGIKIYTTIKDLENPFIFLNSQSEKSIYRCKVVNRIKIGDLDDKRYLIATLHDLMLSLTEVLQGFSICRDFTGTYYLLVCENGEYIMNPDYKEVSNEIK